MDFINNNESDEYGFDYCLLKYILKSSPIGKLKSVKLLFEALALMNACPEQYDFIDYLQTNIGNNQTIWGIKKTGDQLFTELYFYNYNALSPQKSVKNLIALLKQKFDCGISISESVPCFMISLDVNNELFKRAKLDSLHVYTNNRASGGMNGISYLFSKNAISLENFYYFFAPNTFEIDLIKEKILNSAMVDFRLVSLDEILLPQLTNCKKICTAFKSDCEAIYYSGINIEQFLFFLNKFNYQSKIISFIEANKHLLDYLQFDVGFDYRMSADKLEIVKSGYYGVF